MQQPPRSRSQGFALFRPHALEEIPHIYSWFEEMRTQDPVFYVERTRLCQGFRYEDVLAGLTDYTPFSSQGFGLAASFLGGTLWANEQPDPRKFRNPVNPEFDARSV